jgi:hypothetical protein
LLSKSTLSGWSLLMRWEQQPGTQHYYCAFEHERREGMGPSLTVEGATTAVVFEAYVERRCSCSNLQSGQVVVMDNLSALTRDERVRELIEGRGCQLLYLPAYSPDFNPIEQAFSKIKGLLKKS